MYVCGLEGRSWGIVLSLCLNLGLPALAREHRRNARNSLLTHYSLLTLHPFL